MTDAGADEADNNPVQLALSGKKIGKIRPEELEEESLREQERLMGQR